jgi:peptidoglycan/xylan/chitin deacetylase (PgdA/CDA1 family)
MPKGNKRIYLTFDDGPHPDITPSVLVLLKEFDAKATFFCVGQNVEKFPETYQMILSAGHITGNHSFNHMKGWKNSVSDYYENIKKASLFIQSDYFRPPYGRITPAQIRKLKKEYRIVMWSVLSYDFDREISAEQCFKNVIYHAQDGDIVVFHDSEKASHNMLSTLPKVLEYFKERGFSFASLED